MFNPRVSPRRRHSQNRLPESVPESQLESPCGSLSPCYFHSSSGFLGLGAALLFGKPTDLRDIFSLSSRALLF